MPDDFDPLPFQIDHVISRQHRGSTTLDNLALACLTCNNHKGPNIAGIDPDGAAKDVIRLFRPREDKWDDHFQWEGPLAIGRTPIGRVAIHVLAINLSYRVALRQTLIDEGVFPPAT
jgi:hypothetical protein